MDFSSHCSPALGEFVPISPFLYGGLLVGVRERQCLCVCRWVSSIDLRLHVELSGKLWLCGSIGRVLFASSEYRVRGSFCTTRRIG